MYIYLINQNCHSGHLLLPQIVSSCCLKDNVATSLDVNFEMCQICGQINGVN